MKRLKLWKRRTKQYLELKNSTSELKNALGSTGNRADHLQEEISVLKDRNLKIIHVKDGKELISFLKMKMLHKNYLSPFRKGNIGILSIPEREEKRRKQRASLKKQ